MKIVDPIVIVIAGFVFGVISAVVASSKGRPAMPWFFAGFFLGPIGLILTAVLVANSPPQTPEAKFDVAIRQGDVLLMGQMIEQGVIDPNGKALDGKSSWLRVAVKHEGLRQAEVLLKRGADPSRADGFGRSVLDYLRDKATEKTDARQKLLGLLENPPSAETSPEASTPAGPSEGGDLTRRLSELADMKERGLLSDEEFSVAKARILRA